MTQTFLDQCREVESRATVGPWLLDTNGEKLYVIADHHPLIATIEADAKEFDAEFIAFSRTAMPELVRRLERAIGMIRLSAKLAEDKDELEISEQLKEYANWLEAPIALLR